MEIKAVQEYNFLCLSHTYIGGNDHMDVDALAKQIDFGKYDMLLFGGDILEHTTQYADTFEWLNSIFLRYHFSCVGYAGQLK